MLSHLKRRIGVLTAVTVLAALVPLISSSTVSAAPLTTAANPTNASTYSACPTSANIPAAGFTDTTSTDVDCIAYYGITTGVTATTYEPAASVPRWQMALYLTRMATETGHTLGSGADQGFTDISGYAADIQTAINQLKQLTVTLGTTTTTYSPDDNVTREQMAMFVERLLGLTAVGPNTAAVSSAALLTTNIGTLETQNAYNYTDIDGGGVSFEGHEAIEELYNLGVPGDLKTVTTFSPAADITRADMATWLTNALGHTNLRPAGVNIQLSVNSGWANTAPTVSVTYRDANFDAVAGQVVDAFWWKTSTTAGNTEYVDSSGNCKLKAAGTTTGLTGSLTKCYVDVGDPTTNASGNIAYGSATVANGTSPTTLWAWTAASGTTYDSDTDYGTDVSSTVATSTLQAANIVVDCDVNAYAKDVADEAPFEDITQVAHGTTITITLQMSAAVSSARYAAVAQPDNAITLTHTIAQAGAANVAFASVTTNTLVTDASGTATYSFTQADPNSAGAGQDYNQAADNVNHSILIADLAIQDATTGSQDTKTGISVADTPCWSDDDTTAIAFKFIDYVPAAAAGLVTATPSQNVIAYKAAATAAVPVPRTATVTGRDKLGNVVPSATGGAVFYGGPADALVVDADMDAAADSEAANAIDPGTGATSLNLYPVNSGICFVALDSTPSTLTIDGARPVIGQTYYVDAGAAGAGGTANEALVLSTTISGGVAGTAADLVGNTKVGDIIARVHPTMGCGARIFGPSGTASIAWNDTNTGVGMDMIWSRTSAGESTTSAMGAGTYAFRWIDPSDTVIGSTVSTSNNWVETDGDDAAAVDFDNAADLQGMVILMDAANNTILVDIAHGTGGSFGAASHTIHQYSYDSNDYFFLCANRGVPAASFKGTTDAGFEGYYGPYGCSYGLNALMAGTATSGAWTNVEGVSWANGSIDSIAYEAQAANISIFKTGAGLTG